LVSRPLVNKTLEVLVASGAAAIAAYLIGSGHTHRLITVGLALVAIAAIVRWPAVTIVSVLIICQELDPAGGFGAPGSSGLLFLGHQLYFQTLARFSLLTLLVLLAFGRVVIAARPRRPRRIAALLVLGLGAYYTALLWAHGTSLTSAINQDARYAILFGACFAVGAYAAGSGEWARHALPVLQWLLTGMALIGMYLAATGQGQGALGENVIFYDSAMGAMAGAAVLAAALTPPSERDWRLWWLAAAGVIVVVLAARRNVYAAMAVALLLSLTVIGHRGRLALRIGSMLVIAVVCLAVVAPTVLSGVGHQLGAIWGATQGSAADASVKGHLSDVSLGWAAVKRSPVTGVGPTGQLPGLIVEGNGPLYIHNQVLESWLRFGLLGAILVIAIQVVFVVQGLLALLLIMAPVAMLTAPFLTNTQRWPAILGFAAGLLAATRRLSARGTSDVA
jgi:O-antigen ligase